MGLFQAAILQSDPMVRYITLARSDTQSYGLSSTITTGQLRDAFYSSDEFGGCTDLECLQAVPILGILNAQRDLLSYAPYTFDSVPLAEGMSMLYERYSQESSDLHTGRTLYPTIQRLFSSPIRILSPFRRLQCRS